MAENSCILPPTSPGFMAWPHFGTAWLTPLDPWAWCSCLLHAYSNDCTVEAWGVQLLSLYVLLVLLGVLTLLCGLQPLHEAIKFAICLWGEPSKQVRQDLACQVLSFQDVLDAGASSASNFQMADIKPSDLATFVYTSGTTGNPKVCHSFGQYLFQHQPLEGDQICRSREFHESCM